MKLAQGFLDQARYDLCCSAGAPAEITSQRATDNVPIIALWVRDRVVARRGFKRTKVKR
jgi:hypothetical protein